MPSTKPKLLLPLFVLLAASLLVPAMAASSGPRALAGAGTVYLPIVLKPACPGSSGNQYSKGSAYQVERDNPVRPAWNHADKNLALRGYTANLEPGLKRELVSYGTDDKTRPPQFATMFYPNRVPVLRSFYKVYDWNWAPSPNPGTRGAPLTSPYRVTALGLQTTPGDPLFVPSSDYSLRQGMEVLVLFADEDSVTLKYTRADGYAPPYDFGYNGYTLHVDGVCTDPSLLALYAQLDDPSGPRYRYVDPSRRPYTYDLPSLPAGQSFGTAKGSEVVLAIADTGQFMDPRSCNEWWQVRPGYTGSCPPPE